MTTFQERIQELAQEASARVEAHPKGGRVVDGTATREEYGQFLASCHHAVDHAPRLLSAAHARMAREGVTPQLVEAMRHKMAEEDGHVDWLADDAQAIGLSLHAPSAPKATAAARAYVELSYRLIDLCAASFFGAAFILESLSVTCAGKAARNLQRAGRIQGISTANTSGVSFLSKHYDADVHHTAEMATLLATVEEPRLQHYILLSARMTATFYPDFFG